MTGVVMVVLHLVLRRAPGRRRKAPDAEPVPELVTTAGNP